MNKSLICLVLCPFTVSNLRVDLANLRNHAGQGEGKSKLRTNAVPVLSIEMPPEMQKSDSSLVPLFQEAGTSKSDAASKMFEHVLKNDILYRQQGAVLQLVVPQVRTQYSLWVILCPGLVIWVSTKQQHAFYIISIGLDSTKMLRSFVTVALSAKLHHQKCPPELLFKTCQL